MQHLLYLLQMALKFSTYCTVYLLYGMLQTAMSYMELSEALTYAKARIEKLENDVNVAGEKYEQLREVYTAVIAENMKLKTRYVS